MGKDFDIKKEYESIQKRYNLPDFEGLDNEFELSNLKDLNKKFLLRMIRRRINEKIVFFNRILESVLHPNTPSIVSMHENKFFSDEDKKKALKMLRLLMKLERENLSLDVDTNEKSDVGWIIKVNKEFLNIKKELKSISKFMEEAWSKEEEKVVSETYFG